MIHTSKISCVVCPIGGADVVFSSNPVLTYVFCFRSIKWSRTLGKMHISYGSLGSMCFRSLSLHTEISIFESHFMTCTMSYMNIDHIKSTCRYRDHLHVVKYEYHWSSDKPLISGWLGIRLLILNMPKFSLKWANGKFNKNVYAVPCSHLEIGYNRKQWVVSTLSPDVYDNSLSRKCHNGKDCCRNDRFYCSFLFLCFEIVKVMWKVCWCDVLSLLHFSCQLLEFCLVLLVLHKHKANDFLTFVGSPSAWEYSLS